MAVLTAAVLVLLATAVGCSGDDMSAGPSGADGVTEEPFALPASETPAADAAAGSDGDADVSASPGGTAAASATDGTEAAAPQPRTPLSDEQIRARTTVNGVGLPPLPRDGDAPDPAVGLDAPRVSGIDLLTGEPVEIGASRRPLVIGFFAHWCPHCQAELAELSEFLTTDELPTGADFVSVSIFEDPDRGNWPPAAWFAGESWRLPVIADNERRDVIDVYAVESVPMFVAVSADGEVVRRQAGSFGPEQLVDTLEWLLDAAR